MFDIELVLLSKSLNNTIFCQLEEAQCSVYVRMSCICLNLSVVAVWTLSVGRGDAGLHCLDPGLSELL